MHLCFISKTTNEHFSMIAILEVNSKVNLYIEAQTLSSLQIKSICMLNNAMVCC